MSESEIVPREQFTTIPDSVQLALAPDGNAAILWGRIHALELGAKKQGRPGCYASNDYLARALGWSVETVRKALARIEKEGLLRRWMNNGMRFICALDFVAKPAGGMEIPGGWYEHTGEGGMEIPGGMVPGYHQNKKGSSKDNKKGERAPEETSKGRKTEPYTFTNNLNLEVTVPVNLTTHTRLLEVYGQSTIDAYYNKIANHCSQLGEAKKYKDFAATAVNWMDRDGVKPPERPRISMSDDPITLAVMQRAAEKELARAQ